MHTVGSFRDGKAVGFIAAFDNNNIPDIPKEIIYKNSNIFYGLMSRRNELPRGKPRGINRKNSIERRSKLRGIKPPHGGLKRGENLTQPGILTGKTERCLFA
jgi:hypothetical protein